MDSARPRGILSPADRAYLLGEADLKSDQSAYDARYRIRERVKHALLDFELLFDHLADQDRSQVFTPGPETRDALTEGVVCAIAFLYLGTGAYDPPRESLFTEGIRRAAVREHDEDHAFCSVRIDVEHPTRAQLERIIDRVESGRYHELGERELRALACFMHRREDADAEIIARLRTALTASRE